MANIKIAQLTNATTISDTDIVLIEDATQTKKMTVATLKSLLGINNGGVVGRGSNLNGDYTKFADGTLICWHTIILNELGWTAIQNDSLAKVWNFPHVFIDANAAVSISKYASNVSDGWRTSSVVTSPGTSAVYLGMVHSTAGFTFVAENTITVRVMAIGRWKA